jgi:hypothetical protein
LLGTYESTNVLIILIISAEMTDAKFEKLWVELSKTQYDLPVELKQPMLTALKAAGFYDAPTASAPVATGGAVGKTKKLSGYNVFMKEKMAELKTQGVASGERMGKVAALWKAMTDADKATWKVKADALAPATTTVTLKATKASGPKKLSGYQLYVKETMPVVKVKTDIAAKDRMGEIGKMWKALSDVQKAEFKAKAEKL